MDANDLYQAAFSYLQEFTPIVLIVAAVSVADLIITFAIKLFKKAPKFVSERRSG